MTERYTADAQHDGDVMHYAVRCDGEAMSWALFIELLVLDDAFRRWFANTLAGSPFEAVFFETPPLTKGRMDEPFEFVLVRSAALARTEQCPGAFTEQFGDGYTVTFENLGGDAILVAPCPKHASNSAHLVAFLRSATPQAASAFLQAVGAAVREHVSDKPLWLSTSGLGVYWLHMRLDSRPKYYQHGPFKKF